MLQTTIEAIERGGEASVRVREVAAAVGVSFPSLYHFFGSREGLIEEALAEIYVRSVREFTEGASKRISRCDSAQDFRAAIEELAAAVYNPTRAVHRLTRAGVLGGASGRPRLAARVAAVQDEANRALADVLREPQRRGWVRPGLDLVTFGAWLTGITLGRVLIELGGSSTDGAAWNKMSIDAIIAVTMGDQSGPPQGR